MTGPFAGTPRARRTGTMLLNPTIAVSEYFAVTFISRIYDAGGPGRVFRRQGAVCPQMSGVARLGKCRQQPSQGALANAQTATTAVAKSPGSEAPIEFPQLP